MRVYAILFYMIIFLLIFFNLYNFKFRMIGNIFQAAVLFSFLYEHGYKLFWKRDERIIFIVVYLIPFLIVLFFLVMSI